MAILLTGLFALLESLEMRPLHLSHKSTTRAQTSLYKTYRFARSFALVTQKYGPHKIHTIGTYSIFSIVARCTLPIQYKYCREFQQGVQCEFHLFPFVVLDYGHSLGVTKDLYQSPSPAKTTCHSTYLKSYFSVLEHDDFFFFFQIEK